MGYRLLDQIMKVRPKRPGPEWWLLYELARDASDRTRRTACGYDYMVEQTGAPRSTIFRWLAKLADAGLLTVVSHSRSAGRNGGTGERAVYEIQVPSMRLESAVIRSHKKGPDSVGNEVSSVGPESPAELGVSRNQVPSMRPPTTDASHRTGTGEGARLRSEQDRSEEEEDKKNTYPERAARRAPAA
jgi:hypothetical protein